MSYQIVNFRPTGDQSWAQSAECAKPGQPDMFPHESDSVGIELARATCNGCPVRQACLGQALDRNEAFGVWGGLSADERRALRRNTLRQAAKAKKQAAKAKK